MGEAWEQGYTGSTECFSHMDVKHSAPSVQYILRIVRAGGCLVGRSFVAEHWRLKLGSDDYNIHLGYDPGRIFDD